MIVLGGGSGDDGAVVGAVGPVVCLAAGGDAQDPLECGERGVCDVADGVDPVAGERARGGRPHPGERGGTSGAEESGDVAGGAADDGGGAEWGDGGGHGRDHPRRPDSGAALNPVEREGAKPDDSCEAFGVAVPVPQGAGEVDVGGQVCGVRLNPRCDGGQDSEELFVQVCALDVEVDAHHGA